MAGTMNAPKRTVVLAALLAIVLLAAGVCYLHWENAVSLRGTAAIGDYAQLQRGAELSLLSKAYPDERCYTLYEDGEKAFGLYMDDPWMEAGIVHIRGTLLRLNQTVGAVNVRVGLIPEPAEAGAFAAAGQDAILLNTQMVREFDFVAENGYDDHCGFHAAVQAKRLADGENQFRVVIADESDGAKRMIMTNMTIRLMEDGVAFARENQPESEVQHD